MRWPLTTLLLLTLATSAFADAWSDAQKRWDSRLRGTPLSGLMGDGMTMVERMGDRAAKAPLKQLMDRLEKTRGLKFKRFVPWHVKDRQELAVFFARQLELYYPETQSRMDEGMLKHLGLVEKDFEIRAFLQELFSEQVAGAYDPDTKEFFAVDIRMDLLTRAVSGKDAHRMLLFHELDHALGDQYYDLKEIQLEALRKHNTDLGMARSALFEGEATLVMFDYQQENMGLGGTPDAPTNMGDMVDWMTRFPLPLPGMGSFQKAPLYFKKALIFPYYNGMDFVSHLRSFGRWQAVNRAYQKLPASTEQILHPMKYYLDEQPVAVSLSAFPKNIDGWQAGAFEDTGGEFLVGIFLEEHGVSHHRRRAQGWGGDRYRLYRKGRQSCFLWLIEWDTVEDSNDFVQGLKEVRGFQHLAKGRRVLLGHQVPPGLWGRFSQRL